MTAPHQPLTSLLRVAELEQALEHETMQKNALVAEKKQRGERKEDAYFTFFPGAMVEPGVDSPADSDQGGGGFPKVDRGRGHAKKQAAGVARSRSPGRAKSREERRGLRDGDVGGTGGVPHRELGSSEASPPPMDKKGGEQQLLFYAETNSSEQESAGRVILPYQNTTNKFGKTTAPPARGEEDSLSSTTCADFVVEKEEPQLLLDNEVGATNLPWPCVESEQQSLWFGLLGGLVSRDGNGPLPTISK